ncbi:hypothetical protein KTT_02660 [Tengunoibacter tsumagoiensis]|uniref:Uncharacterized protein n=1 Tax=Tengunoibacter tsumagoiensis TaxID=2014871 RepID=A0A401ZU86_9CHLR|nr:hypothetical protein KTT_02660 [Tengunoibacter tsumagoiensis]
MEPGGKQHHLLNKRAWFDIAPYACDLPSLYHLTGDARSGAPSFRDGPDHNSCSPLPPDMMCWFLFYMLAILYNIFALDGLATSCYEPESQRLEGTSSSMQRIM